LVTKKSPDPTELQIALDNRAFEIQLFWQRSNYFLVLMTALGIGTFSVKDPLFSPVIALFATACSYFWFRTNLGSKFWQESWEVEVTELSKELAVRSFERPLGEVRDQVRRSLARGQANEKRSFVRRWIDRLTVKKYSVTYNMILLSLVSTILWSLVALALVVRSVAGAGSPAAAPKVEQPEPKTNKAPLKPAKAPPPAPALPVANDSQTNQSR
jgi:hypothetical protein